jgi:hypothetical protein
MELPACTPTWIRTLLAKAVALLDYLVDFFRGRLHFLKPLSPSLAPTHWIYINGSCCICTFMFFLLGWMEEKSHGYQFALDWYIPYNLLICVVWFVEAALWMLFDEASPAWHKLGELGLAFFFVFDGIFYLYEWKILGVALDRKEILIYTVIDFCIYLFYLLLAIREEAKAEQLSLSNADNDTTHDTGKDTSEQGEANTDFKMLA